ncbi:MAG: hypothetical protein WA990_10300 [Rubrobacteraceae bacterium]
MIVTGFHRSGTSLTARILHRAGLFLGDELLGAHPSNPYGHFEDLEVLGLHEEILADNGLDMFAEAPFIPVLGESHRQKMKSISEKRDAEHPLWGFKEPRTSLFLMAWKHLLPKARVLIVYRHYAEATYSLARRHSAETFSGRGTAFDRQLWEKPDLALKSWLAYNDSLLTFARTYPEDALVVSLDTIRAGLPLVPVLNHHWNLGLEDTPGEALETAVTGRRRRQPVSDRRLIPAVDNTWQALEKLGSETERMLATMYGQEAP